MGCSVPATALFLPFKPIAAVLCQAAMCLLAVCGLSSAAAQLSLIPVRSRASDIDCLLAAPQAATCTFRY